jgi:hypothetical protein
MRGLLTGVCSLLLCGCALTPEQRVGIVNAFAAAEQQSLAARAVAQSAPSKLMIFGGAGHRTYLGCLNCGEYGNDSVTNQYSNFGSPYSPTSIANQFGDYGSPYSMYSACNPYATDPPVVVDSAGNFYGRLTVNAYNSQRIQSAAWLTGLCTR